MSRCVGLSCALSVLPTFCFLLFRNNRVILQKSFFKLPNLQAEETSGIFLPRPKHLSKCNARKKKCKKIPAGVKLCRSFLKLRFSAFNVGNFVFISTFSCFCRASFTKKTHGGKF